MVLMEKFLYKQDSKGKIRQWRGYVDSAPNNRFIMGVETGLVDGNKTANRPRIYWQGKQGRDAKGQAIFELESKVSKKRDEGYFDTIQEAKDTLVILPMLALDFNKRSHDISYPAIGQRKFDGVRCMASINPDGSVSLKSRKGKEFPHMNHLRQQIASLKGIPDGAFLDGELYSDTLTFQEVVGLVRRETLNPGDEDKLKQISFRLYDMLDPDDRKAGFQKRYDSLKKILGSNPPKNLILTENFELKDKADVKKYHDQFVDEGYEGIMIRNKDGEYGINKRSKHLQKFKEFFDQEFEIVGYEEGQGNAEGTVIWICITENGDLFSAQPTGTVAERAEYFKNGDDYIGATLTVRYFEMTDDGIPRFPKGVAIRNYE
tara:strand:- start:697 stop:1821 length:1125 start_codon:yes stop_codon:yes gene_type:complete